MAETDPVLYAQTAIGLYSKGTYTPKGGHMTLSVTDEMRNGTEADLSSLNRAGGISSVDAIMQGAITNANNYIENINTFKGESGLNSFMRPAFILDFVRKFMGKNATVINNWVTNKDIASINFKTQFAIATTFYDSDDNRLESSLLTNHYINIIGIHNGTINFWSWGGIYIHKTSGNVENAIHSLYVFQR